MTQPTNRLPWLTFLLGLSIGIAVITSIMFVSERQMVREYVTHGWVVEKVEVE
jgi:hypothetical protein